MASSLENSLPRTGLPFSTVPKIYDTYLCKELSDKSPAPEVDLLDLDDNRLKVLQSSAAYFSKQDRFRAVERLQLETGRVYMENEEWKYAIRVLRPLWQTLSWRHAGWWHLVEEVGWALWQCARNAGDWETLVAVEWELLSDSFTTKAEREYDFSKCLEGVDVLETRPKVVLQSNNIKSCLSSGFAFSSSKGHVGEKLLSQLVISSRAHNQSAPIILTEIRLGFSGGLKDVKFQHDSEAAPSAVAHDGLVHLQNVSLQQASDILNLASARKSDISPVLGVSDLTFAPGTTRVLSFDILPRISGNVEATSVTMCIQEENFDFEIAITNSEQLHLDEFWIQNETRLSKKRLAGDSSIVAKILSKPPKMHIEIPDLRKSYLADEIINLDVKIVNKEEEATEVMLEVQLLGRSGTVPKLKSASKGELSEAFDQNIMSHEANHSNVSLPLIPLGQLEPTEVKKERLSFQARPEAAEYILDIKALYHLLSDPDTSISKTFETEIVFIRPFEANYSLSPRIHPDPWPNYFSTDGGFNSALTPSISIKAGGLMQKWLIVARIASFAAEALAIEDVRLQILDDPDDIVCKISQAGNSVQSAIVVKPQSIQTRQFDIELHKYDIEDRQSTVLNLQLEVQWRRENSDANPAITRVAVPEIIIPFGEPRVLAFARKGEEKNGLIHLDYMIENPSRYVLRFSLTMETSEEFAFSGPKSTSVQLVPLSRHIIRYNVLPLTKGVWISPYFRVVDIHFNKTLKVNASEGVTSDAKGIHIWVDDKDGDDDNG